jgi:elongation factor G
VWNYVRVVRGRLTTGRRYAVRPAASACDVEQIWVMQADRHSVVADAEPGEIVVLPGDLALRTGDTLHDPDAPVELLTPRFPAPVLAVTFEPKRSENGARMLKALRELAIDDPTLLVDHDGAQVTVRGMGELHLDVVAELLEARIGREFQLSRPRVDHRETVRGSGAGEIEIRAVVGDSECAARCRVTVEPLADPAAAAVVTAAPAVPEDLAETAQRELRARLATGLKAGPMSGVKVVVEAVSCDGAPVEALVEQAATKALSAAAERAGLQLLEPWVELDIWSPEVSCAAVMADLGSRGAVVTGVSSGRLGARVQGRAPLAHMLGYVTRLRSITKGRGLASLRPSGFFAELPR